MKNHYVMVKTYAKAYLAGKINNYLGARPLWVPYFSFISASDKLSNKVKNGFPPVAAVAGS